MEWGKFRADKALEVVLYILSKGCTNMYNVLKVIYFADKTHMKMTGHTIFKDRYVAMKNGPVPSGAYDLFKAAKNPVHSSNASDYDALVKDAVALEEGVSYIFKALRNPNLRMFSRADCVSLDEAIEKYGHMPIGDLITISHKGIDYIKADENDIMSFDLFVQSVDDENSSIRTFLEECMEEAVC